MTHDIDTILQEKFNTFLQRVEEEYPGFENTEKLREVWESSSGNKENKEKKKKVGKDEKEKKKKVGKDEKEKKKKKEDKKEKKVVKKDEKKDEKDEKEKKSVVEEVEDEDKCVYVYSKGANNGKQCTSKTRKDYTTCSRHKQ